MKSSREYKVALITESLWRMEGANKVLESFALIYPNSDIFALFGQKNYLSKEILKHNISFSFLNKVPFIKHIYRYAFNFWPVATEQFDLSNYDLVISCSSSVAHGVITPLDCKHVAYINSPMRYAWDLAPLYTSLIRFGFLKRTIKEIGVSFNRLWDVVAAQRADIIMTNSMFVKKRVEKYWGREVNAVIYPPVDIYKGRIVLKRKNYFVSGAPFEANKRGDFLLECASKLGFNLKIVGTGSMKRKLRRKYKEFKNIEFLDWITDEEKWKLISNAEGFIVPGIEDYGIFCAEAISCGTPVIAFNQGGSREIVKEGISGIFFDKWDVGEFERVFKKFSNMNWDYIGVQKSMNNINSTEDFKREIQSVLVE